jgi:hypothetical protein
MREKITASEGHILTNGEIFGKEIYLAEGMNKYTFYEITYAEYQAIIAEQEKAEEPI